MQHRPKILIVDDSKNECFLLSEYLSSGELGNYDTSTANDLTEAHATLATEKFDCIIVDHLLGIETGLDFITQLKASKHASIPVILISGYEAPELHKKAIEAGAALFIAKRNLTEKHINHTVSQLLECAA